MDEDQVGNYKMYQDNNSDEEELDMIIDNQEGSGEKDNDASFHELLQQEIGNTQ